MRIEVHLEDPARADEVPGALDFLLTHGIIAPGAAVWSPATAVDHAHLTAMTAPPDRVDLDVVLSGDKPGVRDRGHARFFVGKTVPASISRLVLPIGGKVIHARWLHHLLTEAERLALPVRLLYCEKALVVREIVRLADWFELASVKHAVTHWLDEDARRDFSALLTAHPNVEISTGIGRLSTLVAEQDPEAHVLLGSLGSGPHIPGPLTAGRYHGMDYRQLLARSGLCGYFLSESKR